METPPKSYYEVDEDITVKCLPEKVEFYNFRCHGNNTFVPAITEVVCEKCPAGTFKYLDPVTGHKCSKCEAGKFSFAGSATCTDCEAGKFSFAGSATCTDCEAGKFSFVGSAACTDCEAGKFSSVGSATCTECKCQFSYDVLYCKKDFTKP